MHALGRIPYAESCALAALWRRWLLDRICDDCIVTSVDEAATTRDP